MANLTIAGKTFEVSTPYSAGPHELSVGEAHALNQTRAENIRNNMARLIKENSEKPEDQQISDDELQAKVTEYDNAYEFGVRQAGSGFSRDPIMVEARALVKEAIRKQIKESNQEMPDAKVITAAAEQFLQSEDEGVAGVLAIAKERVEARNTAADQALKAISAGGMFGQNSGEAQPDSAA